MPLSRITAASIADGTVVAADIADGAVTGPKLGATSINANNIVNGTITGNLLTANCVSGNNIVSGVALTGNVSVTGNVTVGAGTVSNAAISTTGDTNTGIFFPAADNIGFATNGVIRGRWTTDGLCFGSDTAAANALDDYEEGTWTGTIKGSTTDPTTPVTTTGSYTKIGRQVFARISYVDVNTTGASGQFYIAGLPFAPAQAIATGDVMTYSIITATSASINLSPYVDSTNIYLYYMQSADVWAPATHNAGSGRYLLISVVYNV